MTTGLSTEILSKWAKRIAVELEPEREAIAPMMLDADRAVDGSENSSLRVCLW